MTALKHKDTPFPLKRYYLVYGGIGSVLFYLLLFTLFIHAERQALYNEYIHSVSEKARNLYLDIERDFLKPQGIAIGQMESVETRIKDDFRKEIEELVTMDFSLTKLKLFRADAMTLYDHSNPDNEGNLYPSRDEAGFIAALHGRAQNEIVVENDGRRLMEAYLPIKHQGTEKVTAVLEIYEDVTRFEQQVRKALQDALILPTLVFAVFNIVLFLIVAKADRIIAKKTNLLVAIRRNMEKYLSQSAVTAICQAVSERKELFRGERQSLVILFSDIRNFTSYSESTEPEDVVQTLNRVFQIQAEIILKHGGVIDKFVGDEIMVIFPAGHESEAVLTAIEILQAIESRPDINITVGLGIHSGEAVVGSIGTEERRDFTAIGDTINIGARICGACPHDSAYVSTAVFKRLPQAVQSQFSAHNTLTLKGKNAPFDVHLFELHKSKQADG